MWYDTGYTLLVRDPHVKKLNKNAQRPPSTGTKRGHCIPRWTVHCTTIRWTDMALEKTYNRDAKTKLFTGISQKPATMEKYLRALPVLTAVSEETKAMAHLDVTTTKHHEDSHSLAAKNTECVQKIRHVVEEQMINPFTCEGQDLLNISTGQKASSQELVDARETGLAALARARSTNSEKIPTVKLATFAVKTKKSMPTALKAKKVYEAESEVVRSMYLAQGVDEAQKIEVFSHEWTPYPASLFEPEPCLDQGFAMRKGNKSDYLVALKTPGHRKKKLPPIS